MLIVCTANVGSERESNPFQKKIRQNFLNPAWIKSLGFLQYPTNSELRDSSLSNNSPQESIEATGPSQAISCSPSHLCFWLAVRCNHQVHRNLIIWGPDLSTPNWIATTFDQCIKTLTLTLIWAWLVPSLDGKQVRYFSGLWLYLCLACCGQSGQPTWEWWGWLVFWFRIHATEVSGKLSQASFCGYEWNMH